jgi:ribosomal-protein-alanine N-acetyltransferase
VARTAKLFWEGDRIWLSLPRPGDGAEVTEAAGRSEALHAGWVSPPRTDADYAAYLRRLRRPDHGIVNVSNVVLGALRSGYLGYYAFAGSEGRGLMTEALSGVVEVAFTQLDLHRLEANIQPANQSSRALVQRLGFRLEGLSARYLLIDGAWRDHERWALTVEDARPAPQTR